MRDGKGLFDLVLSVRSLSYRALIIYFAPKYPK